MAARPGPARLAQQTPNAEPRDASDALLRLEKALSSPAVGILSFRLDGAILDANPALQRMSGFSTDELRAIHWETLTPPEFMVATLRAAHELATRGETAPYEKQWIRPDGSRWWGLFAPTRLHGVGPEAECLEFIIDITERKTAEHALRESEARARAAEEQARAERRKLHDIFQQAPVPICIVEGPEHIFTFANPPYLALQANPDLIGKPVAEVLPGIAEQFAALLDRVIATGEPYVGTEVPVQLAHRAPGDFVYMNFVYQPMRDADGTVRGILACGSDVTAQVTARQGLEAERDLRERFVASLSHDLRTPLSSAKMGAELIMQGPASADIIHRASRIAQNIDRADRMLQDLLDANRIKAGEKLALERAECNLAVIGDETLRELTSIHGDRFVLRVSGDVVGSWSCNGIRRILENLCSNAVKYGTRDAPITVAIRGTEDAATISVHNAGNPIPREDLRALFEPFHRSAAAQLAGHHGWGLGLTIVRGVAEAHDGHATVTSSATDGTTFSVTLPRTA